MEATAALTARTQRTLTSALAGDPRVRTISTKETGMMGQVVRRIR